jgi:hypothetical protein
MQNIAFVILVPAFVVNTLMMVRNGVLEFAAFNDTPDVRYNRIKGRGIKSINVMKVTGDSRFSKDCSRTFFYEVTKIRRTITFISS